MGQLYLADTQIVIWSIIDPAKISPSVQTILRKNPILVSEVSLLEITIKQKIGRLPELPVSVDVLVNQLIKDGFRLLPVSRKHIAAYERVALFNNHRDPFDRLLLATALSEDIPVISADKNFLLYTADVRVIKA